MCSGSEFFHEDLDFLEFRWECKLKTSTLKEHLRAEPGQGFLQMLILDQHTNPAIQSEPAPAGCRALMSSADDPDSSDRTRFRPNEDQSVSEASGPNDCVVSAPEPLTAEPDLRGAASWNIWKRWEKKQEWSRVGTSTTASGFQMCNTSENQQLSINPACTDPALVYINRPVLHLLFQLNPRYIRKGHWHFSYRRPYFYPKNSFSFLKQPWPETLYRKYVSLFKKGGIIDIKQKKHLQRCRNYESWTENCPTYC